MPSIVNKKALLGTIIDVPLLAAQFEQLAIQQTFSEIVPWGISDSGARFIVRERKGGKQKIYIVTDYLRQNVRLQDGSGNVIPTFTTQPTNQRGFDVYIDSSNVLSLALGQSIIAQGSASLPLNQDATGSLIPQIYTLANAVFVVGTTRVAVMVANSRGGLIQNSGSTNIFIGDSTVTTAKGIKLPATTLTPLPIPSLNVAGLIYAVGDNAAGEVRVLYQF